MKKDHNKITYILKIKLSCLLFDISNIRQTYSHSLFQKKLSFRDEGRTPHQVNSGDRSAARE